MRLVLLAVGVRETLRLEIEHGAVAAAERYQFIVRADLDDPPALEHTDPDRPAGPWRTDAR